MRQGRVGNRRASTARLVKTRKRTFPWIIRGQGWPFWARFERGSAYRGQLGRADHRQKGESRREPREETSKVVFPICQARATSQRLAWSNASSWLASLAATRPRLTTAPAARLVKAKLRRILLPSGTPGGWARNRPPSSWLRRPGSRRRLRCGPGTRHSWV